MIDGTMANLVKLANTLSFDQILDMNIQAVNAYKKNNSKDNLMKLDMVLKLSGLASMEQINPGMVKRALRDLNNLTGGKL